MTQLLSVRRVLLLVAIITLGLVVWLALAPVPSSSGGLEHDHGMISAALANASCTHGQNTHYHDNGRIKHITNYDHASPAGNEHHHHGKLKVITNALTYTINYERECPRHWPTL